jgi:hypothetical protein
MSHFTLGLIVTQEIAKEYNKKYGDLDCETFMIDTIGMFTGESSEYLDGYHLLSIETIQDTLQWIGKYRYTKDEKISMLNNLLSLGLKKENIKQWMVNDIKCFNSIIDHRLHFYKKPEDWSCKRWSAKVKNILKRYNDNDTVFGFDCYV